MLAADPRAHPRPCARLRGNEVAATAAATSGIIPSVAIEDRRRLVAFQASGISPGNVGSRLRQTPGPRHFGGLCIYRNRSLNTRLMATAHLLTRSPRSRSAHDLLPSCPRHSTGSIISSPLNRGVLAMASLIPLSFTAIVRSQIRLARRSSTLQGTCPLHHRRCLQYWPAQVAWRKPMHQSPLERHSGRCPARRHRTTAERRKPSCLARTKLGLSRLTATALAISLLASPLIHQRAQLE